MIYGTIGLASWGQESARLDRTQGIIEIVPPWQLLPIPGRVNMPHEVQGLIRYRRVTKDWMAEKDGVKLPSNDDLKLVSLKIGDNPEDLSAGLDIDTTHLSDDYDLKSTKDAAKTDAVRKLWGDLAEVFIPEPDGTLSRLSLIHI